MKDIYLIRHTTPAVGRGVCYGQTDLDVTDTFLEEVDIIRAHIPGSGEFDRVYTSPLQRCSRLAEQLFPDHGLLHRPELMEVHCGEWEMRNWDDLPKEEVEPWMADFVQVRIPGGESYLDLQTRVMGCFKEVVEAAGGTLARPVGGLPANGGDDAGRRISADGEGGSDAVSESGAESSITAEVNGGLGSDEGTPADGEGGDDAVSESDAGGDDMEAGAIAVVAHGGVIRSILSGITGTPLIDSFKVFVLYYGCVIRIRLGAEGLTHEILSNRMPKEWEQHKPTSYYKK